MKYLLDTNICIRHLNKRSEQIVSKLNSVPDQDIAVCSVVKGELFYGAMRSDNMQKTIATQKNFLNRFVSLSFDDVAAEHYGRIRADLATKGTPIGPNDLLIASIASANNLILVTHNTREFKRVEGLQIEDWESK